MRVLRLFDWRFILSVAFMMLVASVVFSAWSTAQQRDRLIDQNQHAQVVAAQERREAAAERRTILLGQRDLQRKYDGLLRTNKALLVYLRTHGYYIPPDLVPSENADSSTIHSDGHRRSSSHSTGTANSGPDNPSKAGGSGKGSGGSKGSTGGGGKSGGGSHGKSGSKSHGKNAGGKSHGKSGSKSHGHKQAKDR